MKALLLAAGRGRRLSKFGLPKPLVPLLGLPLIERIICNCRMVGIDEFYIVSGYKGKKVRRFLDRLSRKRDVKIHHIENKDWEKENGFSVISAKRYLKDEDRFLLLMCDHIFDVSILEKMLKQDPKDGIVLATDFDTAKRPEIDTEDVTKVWSEDNRIISIGKDIRRYNCYDTGIFLCSGAIFDAIEESIKKRNDSTLSGGVRILSETKRAYTCDITGRFWIDIDDIRQLKIAEDILLKRLAKESDGPISRWVNRPISLRITKFLANTGITPNLITLFSFLLSILASGLILINNYFGLLSGAVLTQLSSIIDGCDGEIARLKFESSDFGKWFDAVLDRYADAFIIIAITYHCMYMRTFPLSTIVFTGFLALVGSFMNSYTADKYDGLLLRLNSNFRDLEVM